MPSSATDMCETLHEPFLFIWSGGYFLVFFLKMDIPVGSRFGSLDWERVSISSSKLPNNYTDSRRSPDIQIGGVPSTSNIMFPK